jgi:uncharacterized protein with PIN domain
MKQAYFRFYAELNDLIPAERRQVTCSHCFLAQTSVKDMIESLGVPHTEIDLILANGESVDFSYMLQDGDYVSVFPVFESLDITPLVRVRPQPLREPRFVLDGHLGRLARYLRMLGFDTLYRNDYADEELARISSEERRILLTRDPGLLKRSVITHGYCIRESDPTRQLLRVLHRFDLYGAITPFVRCLRCNALLQPVRKEDVLDRLLPMTKETHDEFQICPECDRVYWKGSHYKRMRQFVERLWQCELTDQ